MTKYEYKFKFILTRAGKFDILNMTSYSLLLSKVSMMIRPLENKDIDACIAIVDSVWQFKEVFHPLGLAELSLQLYTVGSLDNSNCAYVAEEQGEIVGFLFGMSAVGPTYRTRYSGLPGKIRMFTDLLFLKNVTLRKKAHILWLEGIHEKNSLKAEPQRDHEVNLFAVLPKMQGLGIGKALMHAYISRCMADGVQRITLETDEACNYRFYEHVGFRKKAEFFSPIQLLYTQKSGTSFVYELTLPMVPLPELSPAGGIVPGR